MVWNDRGAMLCTPAIEIVAADEGKRAGAASTRPRPGWAGFWLEMVADGTTIVMERDKGTKWQRTAVASAPAAPPGGSSDYCLYDLTTC